MPNDLKTEKILHPMYLIMPKGEGKKDSRFDLSLRRVVFNGKSFSGKEDWPK